MAKKKRQSKKGLSKAEIERLEKAKAKAREKAKEKDAEAAKAREELKLRRSHRKQQNQLNEHRKRERKHLDEIEHLENLLKLALDMREDTEEWRPIQVKTREKGTAQEGTAVLLFSDIHPEEVVKPETVAGLNDFGPDIAEERVYKLIEGVRWHLETIRSRKGSAGYKIRDFMLCLLGDLISNTIHADLQESNAMGPADAINFVFDLIQTVIDALLEDDELERIIVPCVMGNHDRMTKRNRHQTKAQTSLATIVYAGLQRLYEDEPRVEFDIARGNLLYVECYGKMIRNTHGDDIRYNGGVGGLTIPMRKALDSWDRSVQAAITNCGHWHQVMDGKDFCVNGSIIGYGPFAQAIKARFEPAAQVFYVIDPARGKRLFTPIQVQDCPGHWS